MIKYSRVPDKKKYGFCGCNGCSNVLSEYDVEVNGEYCRECRKHIVFIDEPGADSGWYYCGLHEFPPTEEERVDYIILTKAYKKFEPNAQTRGHEKKDRHV